MNEPKLTVVVLTYNRPGTLVPSLDSILAQDYDDFGVLVMDNCSTDDTPRIVQSYAARDSRVRHVRNEKNIGIARNWNRGLALNTSPYVCVCHDDDLMLSGFLRQTVEVLERHPSVGFVLVQPQFIDQDGIPKDVQDVGNIRDGLMSGIELTELWVNGRGGGIFPPAIVMRRSAVMEALPVESPHTRGFIDLSFYYRMAALHDVYFIRKPLVQYRVHGGSDTELLHREAGATPWYGDVATRIDSIATLLQSPRAADQTYRDWLADRLLYLHKHASAAIHPSIPAMYHSWETRLGMVQGQLLKLTSAGERILLVDDGQLGLSADWNGRLILPFLERDGGYWGPPDDDAHALRELDRMIASGLRWIVIAWPCFWWLDRYWRLRDRLAGSYPCRVDSPHVVAYELA